MYHICRILLADCAGKRCMNVQNPSFLVSYLAVVLKVVGCCLCTTQQVAGVEWVVHIPPDAAGGSWQVAYTKLLPLQDSCMEVAQRKDDGPELGLLSTRLQDLLVEVVVSTAQIRAQPLRRLIGQFDGVLEKGDWQPTLQCRRRLSGQEEPVIQQWQHTHLS